MNQKSRNLTNIIGLTALLTSGLASAMPNPNDADVVQHDRSYFLSEIGGCANLQNWVSNVAGTGYANATLVIDESCTLQDTLTLPRRMVLAGVGRDGEGELVFEGLLYAQAAIAVEPGPNTAGVTIRDLRIVGSGDFLGRGIVLDGAHHVMLERLRISGFSFGIYGREATSTIVDKSSLHDNDVNIFQDAQANSWRVTNSTLSQARRWGLYQHSNGANRSSQSGSVYANNRVKSNGLGGMQISGVGTVVQSNMFTGNGANFASRAVNVTTAASHTRLLSNYYANNCPVDSGSDTEQSFGIDVSGTCP